MLDKQDSRHPYYIQLLEMRGIMLDRVLKLLDQINGGNQVTAVAIEVCQKKPEGCKKAGHQIFSFEFLNRNHFNHCTRTMSIPIYHIQAFLFEKIIL